MSGAANQTFRGSATLTTPSKKKITPINVPLGGVEHRYAFQQRSIGFFIKANNNASIKLAFILGDSATNCWTVPGGCVGEFREINFDGDTLYFQTTKPCNIEIMELYF